MGEEVEHAILVYMETDAVDALHLRYATKSCGRAPDGVSAPLAYRCNVTTEFSINRVPVVAPTPNHGSHWIAVPSPGFARCVVSERRLTALLTRERSICWVACDTRTMCNWRAPRARQGHS